MKPSLIAKGARSKLGRKEREFLTKVIPAVNTACIWATEKCQFIRKAVRYRLLRSVLLAEVIHKSEWGSHPLARDHFNYSLMEVDKDWSNKSVQEHGGVLYKVYKDANDWAMHVSDLIAFSGKYDEVFLVGNPESQIKLWCLAEPDYPVHVVRLSTLRDFYQLGDFDE